MSFLVNGGHALYGTDRDGVSTPGIGDVVFDLSPNLAPKHTICEQCLPSVRFLSLEQM